MLSMSLCLSLLSLAVKSHCCLRCGTLKPHDVFIPMQSIAGLDTPSMQLEYCKMGTAAYTHVQLSYK